MIEGGPPLPKPKYLARGNAFCDSQRRETLEDLARYRSEQPSNLDPRKLFAKSVGDVILPHLLFWRDAVSQLTPPKADAAYVENKLHVWEHVLEAGNAHPYHFETGLALASYLRAVNEFARSYGLTHCIVTAHTFPGGG